MGFEYSWIEEIEIDSELGYHDEDNIPIKVLKGLSRINIFIGQTNTGKSRLLRYLSSLEDPIVWWGGNIHSKLKPIIFEISDKAEEQLENCKIIMNEFKAKSEFARINNHSDIEKDVEKVRNFKFRKKASQAIVPLNFVSSKYMDFGLKYFIDNIESKLHSIKYSITEQKNRIAELENFIEDCKLIVEEHSELRDGHNWAYNQQNGGRNQRFFIPSQRISNRFYKSKGIDLSELYQESFFSSLVEGQITPRIWTGETLIERLEILKGKDYFPEFEDYIAHNILGVRKVKIFLEEMEIFIQINEDPKFPIHQLGEGINHLIVMIVPFYNAYHRILFIDEPEHGLHPGHIRSFFNAINEIKKESAKQFFITTHSTILLDALSAQTDVSFFKFSKNKEDKLSIKKIDWGDSKLIQELGIRPGTSMLVNATIWVEGITDRKVFSHWLKIYLRKSELNFIEGVHYAIAEYSGSNRDHWSFIEHNNNINLNTFCGPNMIILDKDSSEAKINDRKKVKSILKDRAIIVPGRELENLYPARTIKIAAEKWGAKSLPNIRRTRYKHNRMGEFFLDTLNVKNKVAGESKKTLTSEYKNQLADLECSLTNDDNFDRVLSKEVINKVLIPMRGFIIEMNS